MDIEAIYVDTSVMVKLYIEEPDSGSCEDTVSGNTLVSSRLLYCEFQSAISRKASRGIISSELRSEIWNAFETHIATGKIHLLPLTDLLIRDAAELLRELHPEVPLRTLDALHLSTYMSAETGPLFTKDIRMLQAAGRLGLALAV